MDASTPAFYAKPGLLVEVYDNLTLAEWETSRNDVPFYLAEAKVTGGPLLDLGCGTGRLSIPLLSTGLEVSALDASRAMLDVAQQKRAQLPPDTANRWQLHHGDMRGFELTQKFALTLIPFRSFQLLLTPESQRQCLLCIHRHLQPNGKAIINLFDPRYDLILPGKQKGAAPPKELIHPVSQNVVRVEILERVSDLVTQTFKESWQFTEIDPRGATVLQEAYELQMRWTFRYEMRHLVETCGFSVEAEYSNFHRSPPAYGQEQIWMLRRR